MELLKLADIHLSAIRGQQNQLYNNGFIIPKLRNYEINASSNTFIVPVLNKSTSITISNEQRKENKKKELDFDIIDLQRKLDIQRIMNTKSRSKVSPFGRVLCAKYKKVTYPYIIDKVDNMQVKRFDFNTKSPDDEIHERRKRPTVHITCNTRFRVSNIRKMKK
jgi:hypothetical protein